MKARQQAALDELRRSKECLKPKFKAGDHLVPNDYHVGLDHATVMRVDEKNYYLKIMCGIAILPIEAQVNYKLLNEE